MNAVTLSPYQRSWRRMLVDLEIPSWEERFLSEFDAQAMATLYARAEATGVMFSCKNLSGLCFWPTEVGETHPGIGERDVVAETAAALAERGIAACAYYSVIYDNWAHDHDTDWRFEPAQGWARDGTPHDRHGLCCPNSPGYREYIEAQIADLYGRYAFECTFCDMTFWPGVCACRHCRDRFRAEHGGELPERVDWTDPRWCAFQAARERWIVEFTALVTDAMKSATPGIAVYHNFAPAPSDWWRSLPFAVAEHQDFLGADLYGDATEQLIAMKLMNNLARSRPVEFMTFATTSYREHVELKRLEHMRRQVLAATAESTAFMFIEAIDPVGTANAGAYARVAEAFAPAAPFEPYLGGEPIEDVAVYFSSDSKLSFASNGMPLDALVAPTGGFPHLRAVRGACRALQRAHVPFGVITRRQLDDLDRYRVVVLPSLVRIDADEVAAFRGYVERGGRLYASRYTSLLETRGVRHDDFLLGDVFGVALHREEDAGYVYARPAAPVAEVALADQRYLSARPAADSLAGGLLRLAPAGAETLATLTLPYAHPEPGHFSEPNWASIHTSPPWEDTDEPVIATNAFGAGRCVYSALDFEAQDSGAAERLFSALVLDLLGDAWSFASDVDPSVAISAFADTDTVRVSLLNCPAVVTRPATLRLRPRKGRFVALEDLPSGEPVAFTTLEDGTLECELGQLPELRMLLARLEG